MRSWRSPLDLQATTLNRLPGRSLQHRSIGYIELRAMTRAGHGALLQIPPRQRALAVGAGIVEGVKGACYVGHGDPGAFHVEGPHLSLLEVFRSAYHNELGHISQLLSISRPATLTIARPL